MIINKKFLAQKVRQEVLFHHPEQIIDRYQRNMRVTYLIFVKSN